MPWKGAVQERIVLNGDHSSKLVVSPMIRSKQLLVRFAKFKDTLTNGLQSNTYILKSCLSYCNCFLILMRR